MNKFEQFLTCKNSSLLFLRVWIGIIYLYYGIGKVTDWSGASEKFISMGFPGFLGGPIGVIEIVGALLLITGVWFKWANWTLAGIIIVAVIGVWIPASIAAGDLVPNLQRDVLLAGAFWILSAYGPGKFVLGKK